ncbi:MAG: RidA family protein [Candidatus Baltobacteraceae bacterium]
MKKILQPAGWMKPKGYANGIVATGRFVAIAGQIGWNERGEFAGDDIVSQAVQALKNIIAILAEADGKPEHIVRLTWYVTDKHAYLATAHEIGVSYKDLMRGFYPAMSLVEVAALLEDRAKVEIEATAIVPLT